MLQILRRFICWIFWLQLLFVVGSAEPFVKQLTFFADPGRLECFHHPIAAGEYIRLNYQVIDGGDINFMLMDPNRVPLVTEQAQTKGKHDLQAKNIGSYQLCFDNTISTVQHKIISFNLEIAAEDYEHRELVKLRTDMHQEYHFDRAYTEMHGGVDQIWVNLMRARQLQDMIRAYEAHDRKLAEHNYTLVNDWSALQFVAMVLVGLLQVYMLRSIFQTQGRIYRFWQRL